MKISKLVASLSLCVSFTSVHAEPEYYASILQNARSGTFYLTIADSPKCKVSDSMRSSFVNLTKLIHDRGALNVIDTPSSDKIPDLGVLVLIDTSEASENFSPNICNFLIKLSVYHSTPGYLRYDKEQKIVRVLAYQREMYGSVPPHLLTEEANKDVDTLMVSFLKQLKNARELKAKQSDGVKKIYNRNLNAI